MKIPISFLTFNEKMGMAIAGTEIHYIKIRIYYWTADSVDDYVKLVRVHSIIQDVLVRIRTDETDEKYIQEDRCFIKSKFFPYKEILWALSV